MHTVIKLKDPSYTNNMSSYVAKTSRSHSWVNEINHEMSKLFIVNRMVIILYKQANT